MLTVSGAKDRHLAIRGEAGQRENDGLQARGQYSFYP